MENKKKALEWLLDHGIVTAYLFLLTTSLAISNVLAMIAVAFIVWWDRVH